MSFDKSYPNRKDHRAPYQKPGSRADRSCRPGGDCPYCSANRQHSTRRRELAAADRAQIEE